MKKQLLRPMLVALVTLLGRPSNGTNGNHLRF